MSDTLEGKKIAILVANSGVEQAELTAPRKALEDAGATVDLLAPEKGKIQAFTNDVEKADTFEAVASVEQVTADDYDGLVLPGGTTNADQLRTDVGAVEFAATFAERGKPIASICHGPWTLIEAGVVQGKTLTSWPSLKTDIRNAGGEWVDEESVTCTQGAFTLVTSRDPGDLDAFGKAAVAAFAAAPKA